MTDEMDPVFRALADPGRRLLLDRLFERDGQTLGELCAHLPAMTRFGVMKHLAVLEDANVVTTRRRGREKLHFLNPVPIRLVHDRWVSKYAEPWAARLTGLKHRLEETTMEKVFVIYIKTTPERLWAAITDDASHRRYNFGVGIQSDWTPGSAYTAGHPQAPEPIFSGENVIVEAPHRLVQTYDARWGDDVKAEATSRVTWLIEPIGDSCRLTVTHDQLREGANEQIYGGWPEILSGIKTLLETGSTLTTPGSLMYAGADASGTTARVDHVYAVYIKASPERVWHAITDGDDTARYYYGTRVRTSWEPGAALYYDYPDGTVAADGSVVSVDAGREIVMDFLPRWSPEIEAEGPIRMTWSIEPTEDGGAKLTVTNALIPGSPSEAEFTGGIVYIVSGLKTWLETGAEMAA